MRIGSTATGLRGRAPGGNRTDPTDQTDPTDLSDPLDQSDQSDPSDLSDPSPRPFQYRVQPLLNPLGVFELALFDKQPFEPVHP